MTVIFKSHELRMLNFRIFFILLIQIYNWELQEFSHDYDQASHATYVRSFHT